MKRVTWGIDRALEQSSRSGIGDFLIRRLVGPSTRATASILRHRWGELPPCYALVMETIRGQRILDEGVVAGPLSL